MFLIASRKVVSPSPLAATSDRIAWVYHARGLAIMLIVYRHLVLGMKAGGVPVSDLMYNLQMVVFNFRMPAFFILSGVFIERSLHRKTSRNVAWSKVSNLLYPYVIWACVTLVLQIFFSQFSNARRHWDDFIDIIAQPRTLDQLWYLLALFNVSMLYLLLRKFLQRQQLFHFAIALALHFASFAVQRYSLISDFFYFYLFFFIGAAVSPYLLNNEIRNRFFTTANFFWIIPVFLLGQWFWFSHMEQTDWIELLFIAINLVGCYVLFMCAMLIARGRHTEWLAYIGRYSLYVYILHVQIAAIIRKLVRGAYPHVDPWLLLTICFVCGIVLPIVLVKSLRKYGIERLFTLQKRAEA